MNNLFTTAGDLLYIVFSIVGFPVLLVFKVMIWMILGYRLARRQAARIRVFRAREKGASYPVPRPAMGLAFQKVSV